MVKTLIRNTTNTQRRSRRYRLCTTILSTYLYYNILLSSSLSLSLSSLLSAVGILFLSLPSSIHSFHSPVSNNNMSGTSFGSLTDSIYSTDSSQGLHRRRTIYLIRHGEAEHNVLEAKAQKEAEIQAKKMNLSKEETYQRMEEARKSVLTDVNLRDAALTEKGKQQARDASKKLNDLIVNRKIHHPTEAICSPLSRCLETCKILCEDVDISANIRPEIAERRTLYPPDKPKPIDKLLRYTRNDDRFTIDHINIEQLSKDKVDDEIVCRESKEMLRERASQFFDLLMDCEHRHVLVVSHKGFLRELERGLFELDDSPLFDNCELRIYQVIFSKGDRRLYNLERLA
jgi:broad specificity phosphatase PhoE